MLDYRPRKAWLERYKERLNLKVLKGEILSPTRASNLTGSNWGNALNFNKYLAENKITIGYTPSGEEKKLIKPPEGWVYVDPLSDLVEAPRVLCGCGWENIIIPGHAILCPNCEKKWFVCRCGEKRDITNDYLFTCHRCKKNYFKCSDCLEVTPLQVKWPKTFTCPTCSRPYYIEMKVVPERTGQSTNGSLIAAGIVGIGGGLLLVFSYLLGGGREE